MKPIVKQKQSTVQDIMNKAQAGGGSGGDSYTKAEADAKFETKEAAAATYLSKTDAASTYLSKSDAATNYQAKGDYIEDEGTYFTVNGIRIYVSATAPTGDIPDGSLGFGF